MYGSGPDVSEVDGGTTWDVASDDAGCAGVPYGVSGETPLLTPGLYPGTCGDGVDDEDRYGCDELTVLELYGL